jgi:hypothetical protein
MRKRRKSWFRKFLVNAIMWLAAKILQPIPIIGTLAEVVALAI